MNNICHWELQTKNPDSAIKFYEPLFGWKMIFEKEMNYLVIDTGTPPGGGMNIVEKIEPSAALLYVLVEDIDKILKKAEQLGGKVIVPKKPIPKVGHFGILQDGEGNQVGVFTPLPQ
jgi:uncharacterized protein